MPRLLAAGWELESAGNDPSSVTAADLRELSRRVHAIDVKGILDRYADVLLKVCDLGVAISDRRAIKVLKLVADSAVLCGQGAANPIDLWVLRYVWDREEQIAPLTSLVAGVLDPQADEPAPHPSAAPPGLVDGEELARPGRERSSHKQHLHVPGRTSPALPGSCEEFVPGLNHLLAEPRHDGARQRGRTPRIKKTVQYQGRGSRACRRRVAAGAARARAERRSKPHPGRSRRRHRRARHSPRLRTQSSLAATALSDLMT